MNNANALFKVMKLDGTTDSGARLRCAKVFNTITGDEEGNIAQDAFVQKADGSVYARVLGRFDAQPTEIEVYVGEIAVGDVLQDVNDADNNFTITVINSTTQVLAPLGKGNDPVNSYDDYEGAKITVDTSKVRMISDLIYYEGKNNRFDQMEAQMNSDKGIALNYSTFRNSKFTLTEDDGVTSYGQKKTIEYNRNINVANAVLRSIHWNMYPSGTQNKSAFPYQGKAKYNPLLLKYCSRASLVEGGNRYQVVLNSVPYFSSEIQESMVAYREMNKVFGNMHSLNKACWQGYDQARQLDNWNTDTALSDANPSLQPGFSVLDSNTTATAQYELSDVRSGLVNHTWNGISQHHARGMSCMSGTSFKLVPNEQMLFNGQRIGSLPVSLELKFDHTYHPYYSGECTLSIFAEVEQQAILKNGHVTIVTPS